MNVEVNVDSSERSASVARARPQDQATKQAKAKRAGSASTSRRSPSPKRDYPRGTCKVTRPSQASPRKAEHMVTPAQDLEAFKADMICQSPRGESGCYIVTAFQQGRPPFCHEGRKMVQWWYLYFLLPQRPLPAS